MNIFSRQIQICVLYLVGVWLLRIEAFIRYDSRHWQVICIANPTDGVGVLSMAVSELCRTPAVDRFADELFGANEESEAD